MSSAFRVGDRVRVPLGRSRITGVITEDRGAIGVRGRHLYEVLVSMDPFEPTTFELPEDEIEAMDDLPEPGAAMRKDQIEAYLIHGGLIGILRLQSLGRQEPAEGLAAAGHHWQRDSYLREGERGCRRRSGSVHGSP